VGIEMKHLINDLSDTLVIEKEMYENLQSLFKKNTNFITKGSVSQLEEIVKIEQNIIFKIGKLESRREKIVEEITNILQIDKEEITISKLFEYMDQEEKQKFENLQQEITDVIIDLKKTNELNSKLIKQSLEYIDFSINMLSIPNVGNDYGEKGEIKEEKISKSIFDVKL
jgi:flagellar biosynthesis/type III secretory pathway chaperone